MPNPNLRICLLRRERGGWGRVVVVVEGGGVVLCFASLPSLLPFLIVFAPRHFGATRCSLHQSSNEAVATLAAALIEPRTDSLPGGSVFQSTGPPSRRLSILPPPYPRPSDRLPGIHIRNSPPTLHIIVCETPRKRFPFPNIRRMKFPFERKEEKNGILPRGGEKTVSRRFITGHTLWWQFGRGFITGTSRGRIMCFERLCLK